MTVFRIAKQQWIDDLSGRGAGLTGGRWNLKGVPAVYTSTSLSLCICEILVHTDKDIPPSGMYYAEIELSDELISDTYAGTDLSEDTARIGTGWLKEKTSLAIRVPSAVVPEEYNVIINPQHADFGTVKIKSRRPCRFDTRFFVQK
ncbi:MAG: RES family NAD+ phosphorylase [Treponema sp.]|jgi:RES domain-containing protein|nr:RES family NAD+ phosphorylase [Treponema sp.]